jgi:hypothetical protein
LLSLTSSKQIYSIIIVIVAVIQFRIICPRQPSEPALANKKDVAELFKRVFHELYPLKGDNHIHAKREREEIKPPTQQRQLNPQIMG